MPYQARRNKHRATPREFRVVNAAAAHDFVLEVPGEARLFVLLDVAGQTNIAATAYRDVQRWTCATGICQRICKATSSMKRSASTALSMRRSSSRRHMRSRCASICSGSDGVVNGLRIAGLAKRELLVGYN